MTRKVVVAVDGDTPQAVALLEWAAHNLTLCGKAAPAADVDVCPAVADADAAAASGSAPAPSDVAVTILHAMLPSQVPDWGFYPLYQADKLWAGACLQGGLATARVSASWVVALLFCPVSVFAYCVLICVGLFNSEQPADAFVPARDILVLLAEVIMSHAAVGAPFTLPPPRYPSALIRPHARSYSGRGQTACGGGSSGTAAARRSPRYARQGGHPPRRPAVGGG